MKNVFLIRAIFLAGVAVLAATPGSADAPEKAKELQKPLVEEVTARQIPVPILVWPKDGDSGLCQQFDPQRMLRITVGGKNRIIVGANPTITETIDAHSIVPTNQETRVPLQTVVLFDFWNMGFGLNCPGKDAGDRQRTAAQAFDMARDMIRTEMRISDRVMIARFIGFLKFDTGWITDKQRLLEEIDRIQAEPLPPAVDRGRNINDWLNGMNTLATALSFTRGEKDVLLPITAIPLSGEQSLDLTKMTSIFARASVRVHPISIGSGKIFMPPGLRNVAYQTGGHLFEGHEPTLASAIAQLRSMNQCRVTVFFKPEGSETNRKFKLNDLKVEVLDDRFDLSVPPPTNRIVKKDLGNEELRTAFFYLKHYEDGLRIEAGLAPSGLSGSKGNWKANVILRISITNPEVQASLTSLIVQAIRVYHKVDKNGDTVGVDTNGELARYLSGPEFQKLKSTGSMTLTYLITATPGLTEIAAMVYADGVDSQAVTHATIMLPKAPGPYWAISDRLGRMSNDVVLVPMLGDSLPTTQQALVRGFACIDSPDDFVQSPETRARPAFFGKFRQASLSGREVTAPIFKVACDNQTIATKERCTCLLSFVREPLDPGRWIFVPPEPLKSTDSTALQFNVSATEKQVALKK